MTASVMGASPAARSGGTTGTATASAPEVSDAATTGSTTTGAPSTDSPGAGGATSDAGASAAGPAGAGAADAGPGVTAAGAASSAAPVTAATVDPAVQFAADLVVGTNAERSKAGLAPFATSDCATAQASARAGVLVASGRFEHDPLGPVMTACAASGAGENLALGYRTPADMMAGWMASEGHRANILRAYSSFGIGCVAGPKGWLCAQVFLS